MPPTEVNILCATILSAIVVRESMNWDYRGRLSQLCEFLAKDPVRSSDLARDAFTTCSVDPGRLVKGHTHPSAAAARTSATNFTRKMASYMGVSIFSVGMSRSDQRKGLRGSRQWFWSKDTNVDNRRDRQLETDIAYICDVDYYIDMPKMLATNSSTTVIYTVVPETAASIVDDTSICFDEEGNLITLVAGGGTYSHMLWDYAGDSLVAFTWDRGVPKLVTYALERKQVTMNRQLILLTPVKIFRWFGAIVARYLLSGKTLKRFDPIVHTTAGPFVRFKVQTNEQLRIATGKPNSYLNAIVDAELDEAVATVARLGTTNLMLPTVVSWLGREERMMSTVLTEYHRFSSPKKLPTVFPVNLSVRTYQYEPHNFDQNARPKLEAYMSPLVHEAFAPVTNASSERRCVEGRINSLRKEEPRPDVFRDTCMQEFATLLLEGTVLEPVCYDAVAASQTRPAQKTSLARAVVAGPHLIARLKCFLKAESYTSPKDPRNISTYNDSDKLTMSEFALALSHHCKKFSWYAVGKTPIEIAQRVADICSQAQSFVNVSDYHRMDGTVSYTLRRIDRIVMMKAFHHHSDVLNELLKRNVDNRGTLPEGTMFSQGPSHGSGCPATSVFQTLRAAFTSYLAFRKTRTVQGKIHSPQTAFNSLGIHLGDDGLDADLPIAQHQWAAERVGLVIEASVIPIGQRGVTFLARYYSPEVWYGSLDSMCDIKRQLSKFHTTVRLPFGVTPEHKLVEKSMAFLTSDAQTPVLGTLCTTVLRLSDYRPKKLLGVGTWWSKYEDSVQYPNRNVTGWMDSEFDIQFPAFDRSVFDQWISSARTIKEVLEAPLCAEPERPKPGPVDVVVNDEIIPADKGGAVTTSPTPSENGSSTRRRKRRRAPKIVTPSPAQPPLPPPTRTQRSRRARRMNKSTA